jgi:hypothetical protein
MQDRPTLRELIESVRDFLVRELAPRLNDPRLRFRALIAGNVLTIAGRELELENSFAEWEWRRLRSLLGDEGSGHGEEAGAQRPERIREATARLAGEIRAGLRKVEIGDAVWCHARATLLERLRIANPEFLDRVGAASAAPPSGA